MKQTAEDGVLEPALVRWSDVRWPTLDASAASRVADHPGRTSRAIRQPRLEQPIPALRATLPSRRRSGAVTDHESDHVGQVVGQTLSKGRQRPPRRLNGGVGRGRSRCCRAVLALAGLSGRFAYIVPTQPQLPIPLNRCKLLILLEPASGLEPLTC